MTSKPNDGGGDEGPPFEGGSDPSDEGIDGLSIDEYGNRSVRLSAGPAEVYAYHDYPMKPWRSPLFVGGRLGSLSAGLLLGPESHLRPFSGGRR